MLRIRGFKPITYEITQIDDELEKVFQTASDYVETFVYTKSGYEAITVLRPVSLEVDVSEPMRRLIQSMAKVASPETIFEATLFLAPDYEKLVCEVKNSSESGLFLKFVVVNHPKEGKLYVRPATLRVTSKNDRKIVRVIIRSLRSNNVEGITMFERLEFNAGQLPKVEDFQSL